MIIWEYENVLISRHEQILCSVSLVTLSLMMFLYCYMISQWTFGAYVLTFGAYVFDFWSVCSRIFWSITLQKTYTRKVSISRHFSMPSYNLPPPPEFLVSNTNTQAHLLPTSCMYPFSVTAWAWYGKCLRICPWIWIVNPLRLNDGRTHELLVEGGHCWNFHFCFHLHCQYQNLPSYASPVPCVHRHLVEVRGVSDSKKGQENSLVGGKSC